MGGLGLLGAAGRQAARSLGHSTQRGAQGAQRGVPWAGMRVREVRSGWFGWVPGMAWVRLEGWLLLGPGRGRRDGGGERRGGAGAGGRGPGCTQPGPQVHELGWAVVEEGTHKGCPYVEAEARWGRFGAVGLVGCQGWLGCAWMVGCCWVPAGDAGMAEGSAGVGLALAGGAQAARSLGHKGGMAGERSRTGGSETPCIRRIGTETLGRWGGDHGHDYGMIGGVHRAGGSVAMDLDAGRGTPGVRTMKASEFKAKCLKLMDEVAETGEEIHITKRGRAVAKLTPLRRRRGAPFGRDRDIIKIHGDIGAPIDVEWNAETGKGWVG